MWLWENLVEAGLQTLVGTLASILRLTLSHAIIPNHARSGQDFGSFLSEDWFRCCSPSTALVKLTRWWMLSNIPHHQKPTLVDLHGGGVSWKWLLNMKQFTKCWVIAFARWTGVVCIMVHIFSESHTGVNFLSAPLVHVSYSLFSLSSWDSSKMALLAVVHTGGKIRLLRTSFSPVSHLHPSGTSF